MINKLLLCCSIAALLFAACKKQDNLVSVSEENFHFSSKNVQPVSLISPTVFFVDKDVLWAISNIAAANPSVVQKGKIAGVSVYGDVNSNVFNDHFQILVTGAENSIYNPFTDEILSRHYNVLSRCLIPTRATSKINLPNSKYIIPIRMHPVNKKIYYFSENFENAKPFFDESPINEIRSINIDGTNDELVRSFSKNELYPYRNSDIDFTKKLIYFTKYDGNLCVTGLESKGFEKIFFPAMFGEKMDEGEVKFDAVHKRIFFSSRYKSATENLKRIWRIDASGSINTLVKIAEVNFTSKDNTFTFDISPATNTVFWCKREFNQITKQHSSIVTRVNMDGSGSKIIKTGTYINTIVIAEPKPEL